MTASEKYDRMLAGLVTGLILPLVTGLIIFLFSSGDAGVSQYIKKITEADIITHAVSICVFPNIFLFLIYNRLDMLRAARGVLAITFVWAVLVFVIKIFG